MIKANVKFNKNSKISKISFFIFAALNIHSEYLYAAEDQSVEFNTDVLDVNDRANIDLKQFSHAGYIMPGKYSLKIMVNDQQLSDEYDIVFSESEDKTGSSIPCLTPDLVGKLGLKSNATEKVTWSNNGQCADPSSIPGMTLRGDLASESLYITIPQAWMEYSSPDWDPPSRWDNGIAGVLFDYNLYANLNHTVNQGENQKTGSGNGTAGANLGPWRLRADWQAQYDDAGQNKQQSFDWTRYYLYRAIPRLQSKLTLGQNTLDSQIFDNFQFLGANLQTDSNMIPPNLRGYAPEVKGVAKTNAKVVISQQGRVIYQTQVPAGPFSIDQLNESVSGTLDVRVEEQNGEVHTFQVTTADVPYLSRPGSVRYSVSAGRPASWGQKTDGPFFSNGEFSWGVANGWSLYGGALLGGDYNEASVGIGRDLLFLGAIAFDVTRSQATLPAEGKLSGQSFRFSYSKRFDEYDSQITFAGYRFSQKNFMTMNEYLDARYNEDNQSGSDKERYTVTFNKQFRDLGLSSYISYSRQTYWDRAPTENVNLTLAKYFDIGSWKNINISLSAYRNMNWGTTDSGGNLSITLPLPDAGSLSYGSTMNNGELTNSLGYYGNRGNDNYQVNAGYGSTSGRESSSFTGYYSHNGSVAQSSFNGSFVSGQYSSVGMGLNGGMTLTTQGGALHRSGIMGGTRMLVDTDGVSGVPVHGNGGTEQSNLFGKAVIADVNSYYRNTVSIDVTHLPDNIDSSNSTVQGTLTEGAIGYRKFHVLSGVKLMATIRQQDGTPLAFGASILSDGKENGIVGDDGHTWLVGVNPGAEMEASWDGGKQCHFSIPAEIPQSIINGQELLLVCRK